MMDNLLHIGSYWATRNDKFIYQIDRIISDGIDNKYDFKYWLKVVKINGKADIGVGARTSVSSDWFDRAIPACGICFVPCPKGLEAHENTVKHTVNLVHQS